MFIFSVKAIVCDGAQSNKKAYTLAGISGAMIDLQHSMIHPTVKNENIYFFFDVPHILKCIRNNMLLYDNVQVIQIFIILKIF